jgi:hypothetical protein
MNVVPHLTGPRVAGKDHADKTFSIGIATPISSFGSPQRRGPERLVERKER